MCVHSTCLYTVHVCIEHMAVYITCLYTDMYCIQYMSVYSTCVYIKALHLFYLIFISYTTGPFKSKGKTGRFVRLERTKMSSV